MESNSKKINLKLVAVAAASAILSSAVTISILYTGLSNYKKSNKELVNYYEVKKHIDEDFYEDVDDIQLMDYALKGLVAGLGDDYAEYMTPDEYKTAKEDTSGSLVGIGVTVQKNENEEFEIKDISPNSPSSEADIKPGDIIIKVNGVETKNMDIENLVSLIKGKENTDVTITLKRKDQEIECTLTRKTIESITVNYKMLENHTAYIGVSSFKEVTIEQFEEALNNALSDGAEKLIFDMRNNGGGQVNACEACLDPLLPESDVASAEFKDGHTEIICRSDDKELDMPMAVLINENTASAAELFSSALRDFSKAKLVGKNTFGKGIMQGLYELSNGGGVKLTVARYKTAKSECYHGVGLAPDYEIEIPEETDISEVNPQNDPQLKKAIEILNS